MENASKALLIAGGILIALIIITMALLVFNKISSIKQEQAERTETEQLAAFNAEFEAYDKKVMYGTDVITLINKADENNKKYSGNEEYKVTIKVDNEEKSSSDLAGKEKYIYTCTEITYSNGRVSKMEIKTKIEKKQ